MKANHPWLAIFTAHGPAVQVLSEYAPEAAYDAATRTLQLRFSSAAERAKKLESIAAIEHVAPKAVHDPA